MVRREFCMVSDPQKNQRRTVVGSSSAPVLLVVMAPTSTGRSRRLADVADSGLGRLNWAESAPTRSRLVEGPGSERKPSFHCEQ
jgi:hypothetical protein